jgi:predicted MFS family arabinose efflux permease
MGLDIRLPLGLLFLVTGSMMAIYGLFTYGSATYEKSLGIDINLVWGLILVLFGLAMLLLAYLDRRRVAAAPPALPTNDAPPSSRPRGH